MLGQLRAGSKAPSTRLDSLGSVGYLRGVNRLIAYLRENVMLDFQGDLWSSGCASCSRATTAVMHGTCWPRW